jgi:phage-related protein (TIGR01555 family)
MSHKKHRNNRVNTQDKALVTVPETKFRPISTMDAFQNILARMGTGTPNLMEGTDYPIQRITRNYTLMNSLYRNSWIIGKIIDTKAGDMVKNWFKLTCQITPDMQDKFDKVVKRTKVKAKLLEGLKWGDLYGGAAALMLVEGHEDILNQPLDLDQVMPGSFKGLLIFDRWSGITPGAELVTDINDPEFGLPKNYDITTETGSTFTVHHSRILRFTGRSLPFWEKIAEIHWGASEVERVFEELKKRDNTSGNISQLIFLANLRVLKMSDLGSMLAVATEQQQKNLYNTLQQQNWLMNNMGMYIMDKDDDFDTKQYTFSGINEIYESFMLDVAGASEIPVTRLFGRAPAGLNATGESDLQNYEDMIAQRQEEKLSPVLDKLLPVISMSVWGAIPDDLDYEYNHIQEMSDDKKAELTGKTVEAVNSTYQSGIIGRKTALKELRDLKETTGAFTNITDQDIAEADNTPIQGDVGGMPGEDVPGQGNPEDAQDSPESRVQRLEDGVKYLNGLGKKQNIISSFLEKARNMFPVKGDTDDGGPGSGHFGHKGRPGFVGGSGKGGSSLSSGEKLERQGTAIAKGIETHTASGNESARKRLSSRLDGILEKLSGASYNVQTKQREESREELLKQKKELENKQNEEYWKFTRTAKGVPPVASEKLTAIKEKLGTHSPWQLPYEEWNRVHPISREAHKRNVEKALAEGKPVSEAVLKDYPELREKLANEVLNEPLTEVSSVKQEETPAIKGLSQRHLTPFTERDISRFNNYTHFPKDLSKENEKFKNTTLEIENKTANTLNKWGIKEVPADVREALNNLHESRYKFEQEWTRAREVAPPWTVTGRSNYHGNASRSRAIEENANEMLGKAKYRVEKALKQYDPNRPISSDEPEALTRLKEKLAGMEQRHEHMKQTNAAWRKGPEAMKSLGYTESQIAQIKAKIDAAYSWEKQPYPGYLLTNSSGNMRNVKQRIEELQKQQSRPVSGDIDFDGGKIIENPELNRIQLKFDGKPSPEKIAELKHRGFHWSPSQGVWQRQRSEQATYFAKQIAGVKDSYGISAVLDSVMDRLNNIRVQDGGSGSGNFGHKGRPGEVGGSGKGGSATATAEPEEKASEPSVHPALKDMPGKSKVGTRSTAPGVEGEMIKTAFDTPRVLAARREQAKIKSTHLIDTPERLELRRQLRDQLYALGGEVPKPGKEPRLAVPGGGARKKEHKAWFIMGLPASGKSTIADPLVEEYGAMLIDADEAKKLIPEFGDGKFAGAVHQESSWINSKLFKKAAQAGDNMILPLVGKNVDKVRKLCALLQKRGYEVNLQLMDLNPDEAATRALRRLESTNRFVDPDYILNGVGLKPLKNYDILKSEGRFASYEKYSNDVPEGEKPKHLESYIPGNKGSG